MRGLLRYLFFFFEIVFDYSVFVPSIRKAHPILSVYTADETKNLLESVEVSPNSSKRNNVIILLALRLGMRSGDIANLKITDVDFVSKTVNFIQGKTRVPQQLELLPEIENALESYISIARPDSNIPNVFLSIKSPVRAISIKTVYSLISHRFEKAGIDTRERKHGGHALRMTLASELVSEKVPYDAVRKILGHEDPVSAKHYVKFDIPSLRSCSIEVPPVTGELAVYMKARSGGQIL
jgi:integrase